MAILLAVLCCCVVHVTVAQNPSAESDPNAYAAYVTSDPALAKEQWKKVVVRDKASLEKDPENAQLRYRVALSQFGILSATVRDQDEDLFDEYVDDTEEILKDLLEKDPKWGEARALLSSVYGLTLAYSPWKGIYLGPRSSSLMARALKDTPKSALVWKLEGNAKFFTPESFGGDLDQAIAAYRKAIQYYESGGDTLANWFYLDTLAFLGQALLKKGQAHEAVQTYEKALETEPEFTWVKVSLLPEAQGHVE